MTSDTASISDPQFHAIRLLQGRKSVYSGAQAHYKTPTKEALPGGFGRAGTHHERYIPGGHQVLARSAGRVDYHVKMSGADPPGDLYDQHHRKVQSSITQSLKDKMRFYQR